MTNTSKKHFAFSILSITEDGDTECLLTNRYTDPLFIARRCSIAAADKANGSMTRKAFPEAITAEQSPELFSGCSASIDFDRGVFSVKEHGQWFDLPLQAATAAADWCYNRLGDIPPKERMRIFYLRTSAVGREANLSAPCAPCVPPLHRG
ncbi:MAG: hypothetical protein K1W04_07260 [Oscillospiraceae bacterium]